MICLTLLFVAFTYADDDDDGCYCETEDGVQVIDGCDCNDDDSGESRNFSLESSDRSITWSTNKKGILCFIEPF